MPVVQEPAAEFSGVHMLSPEECWELLAVATVGRLGFVSPSGVQILPVSFRRSRTKLLLKTRPGSLLAQLAESATPMAFEADYHGSDFDMAWSVLVQGALHQLDQDGTQQLEELRRPIQPWPGDRCSLPLQFVPVSMSGRELQHRFGAQDGGAP